MNQTIYADAPTKIELTVLNDDNTPRDMSNASLEFNVTRIKDGQKMKLGQCFGSSDGKVIIEITEPPSDFLLPDENDKYMQPIFNYVSTLIVDGFPLVRFPTRVVLL